MTHAMGDDMSEEETKQRLLGGWWQSGLVDNILTSLQLCMNSTQDKTVEWIRNPSSESDDWRALFK
jgi:hypothetical protein